MKHILIDVDEDLYDRFWDMKNDECEDISDALNHDEALELLLDTYEFIKLHEQKGEERRLFG